MPAWSAEVRSCAREEAAEQALTKALEELGYALVSDLNRQELTQLALKLAGGAGQRPRSEGPMAALGREHGEMR